MPSKTEALVSTPARPVTSVFGFGVKSAKRKQAENPVQPKMSAFTSKPKAPVGTPSRLVTSESGHGVVTSANQGTTVASRPCSLVVQPSSKKPTQVSTYFLEDATLFHILVRPSFSILPRWVATNRSPPPLYKFQKYCTIITSDYFCANTSI